jgi:hypothetical protein
MIASDEGELSIEALCQAFEVSVSGYYAWRHRQPSRHQQAG